MADFKRAFEHTMKIEGGYANDPDDAGKETYRGISRRYFPDWEGWSYIDAAKEKDGFLHIIKSKEFFDIHDPKVRLFYKQEFWNKFWGDHQPNQMIAEEMFDTGVNMSVHRAVKYLQIGLNCLNRDEKLYPDLVTDGAYGQNSHNALKEYLERDKQKPLLIIMNVLQGMHYIDYMTESEEQEKYARGWLDRVSLHKD